MLPSDDDDGDESYEEDDDDDEDHLGWVLALIFLSTESTEYFTEFF